MPRFDNYLIDQLLAPALLLFFFFGGLAAFFIGIGLIFKSPTVSRLFDVLTQSAATGGAAGSPGIPLDRNQSLSKHLILVAVLFVIGGLLADYGLLIGAGNAAIVSMFNSILPAGYLFWIVEAVRYFLVVSCTVSIIVGILMIIASDTLRGTKEGGGKAHSTGTIAIDLKKMQLAFGVWLAAYPRITGLIVTFPALAMMFHFWDQLLRWF